jgi:hypothetical protein
MSEPANIDLSNLVASQVIGLIQTTVDRLVADGAVDKAKKTELEIQLYRVVAGRCTIGADMLVEKA